MGSASSGRQTTRSGRESSGGVVDQRAAVDPGRGQAGGAGDGDGCRGVPLVHPAGVHVGVDLAAHHGQHLVARRSHGHELAVQGGGDGVGLRRGAGAADRDADRSVTPRGRGRCGLGDQDLVQRGQGDGGRAQLAVRPQRHVHRPVRAPGLAVLAGAVEGVHDPHPVGRQPPLVVGGLLAEDGVTGAFRGEHRADRLLRARVTGVAEGAAGQGAVGPQRQQHAGGGTGGGGGDRDVVHAGQASRSAVASPGRRGGAWLPLASVTAPK